MNEIKLFGAIGFILLLSLFEISVNVRKSKRVRQFPLVVLAVLYSVISTVIWARHFQQVTDFCSKHTFFHDGELFIVNACLLLGYAIVRLIGKLVVSALVKKNSVIQAFSFDFYHYDSEYGEWFLKKRWINFRVYFFVICMTLAVTAGIFCGLTWVYGEKTGLWVMYFPCAAAVVLNEIYNFLNGQTKEEFVYSILGSDAGAQKVSNYYKLREILEELLPEPLLTAHSGCEFIGTHSAVDFLKEKHQSTDEKDRAAVAFFEADNRCRTADVDYVQATFQLMQRRNVVFFNPFYKDLKMYLTLPLSAALLAGKKCVVLCGRRSGTDAVKNWLESLLEEYSHMHTLWRVDYLSERTPDCEVGIVTSAQMYDKRILCSNREFFRKTDFVFMIEPSILLNTNQVALNIIAEELGEDGKKPVYCVCDRYTDGLIDILSHLLQAEITDVVAMPLPRCSYTGMVWNADGDFARQRLFDRQTKYLGNGIELAAIAVKNQVPEVTWYSESKAPVKDIKWIVGQYYSTICRYMNQVSQQKKLYEKITFSSALWGAETEKEKFVIVEDEFCNMFSMMRAYLSRGKKQTFVNVLSENYLLRDYMRCNRQVFMADPNAVPSLVPDYSKTERNTLLKLILLMSIRPVSDEEILRELHLAGVETTDAFWTLEQLLHRYTFADSSVFSIQTVRKAPDEFSAVPANIYTVSEEAFEKYFADTLKSAYFIVEDEKDEEAFIDAKLFGHVTQMILPGQFVTYAGKYYIVKYVSPQSGVVLRRASDLYDGRKYYRQIRKYILEKVSKEVVWQRTVGDVGFAELQADICVETTGYLDMAESHNLRTAKVVDISEDPAVKNYGRKYHNKSFLRVRLPDSDDKIRFTLCLLLSEVMRSVFPDGWQYIAIVTRRPDDIEGMLNYMVYQLDGAIDDESIYIIEDSSIDLGLLHAIEKNFTKLMEIVADFLDWHYAKMREPAYKDPLPVKFAVQEAEEKKKRSLVVRMLDRIRKLFGAGERKEEVVVETPEKVESNAEKQDKSPAAEKTAVSEKECKEDVSTMQSEEEIFPQERENTPQKTEADEPAEDNMAKEDPAEQSTYARDAEPQKSGEIVNTEEQQAQKDTFQPSEKDDPDLVAIDGTDIFENEGMPEDIDFLESSFVALGLTPVTKSKYQRECFLKFGFEEIDERIRVDDVRKYLRVRGWANNSLTLARNRELLQRTVLDSETLDHCDFCGLPLNGVSYERLNDGRVRCNDCSSSAISKVEDFRDLFYTTIGLMEGFYKIRYRTPVSVRTTDARTIAKGAGTIFRPSTGVAPRALGYAQCKNGEYSVYIENGSPRLAATDTIVHEMTHIWQYLNWDRKKVLGIYRMQESECSLLARDMVYEGMAMWAAIQYLYQIGESYYAAQQEVLAVHRDDVYGAGFRLYQMRYPLQRDSSLLKYSPFSAFPPLDPEEVKKMVKSCCHKQECKC